MHFQSWEVFRKWLFCWTQYIGLQSLESIEPWILDVIDLHLVQEYSSSATTNSILDSTSSFHTCVLNIYTGQQTTSWIKLYIFQIWASEFMLSGEVHTPVVSSRSNMDVLVEFLESSTIHGLSYISSSKVRNQQLVCACDCAFWRISIPFHCRPKLASVFGP